jgi:hypothetical protein
MNYDDAARMTHNVAYLQRNNWRKAPCPEMTFDHLVSMMDRWSDDMSDTKKCRWLGWMQATVVAMTYPYTSLETMKAINATCARRKVHNAREP